MNLTLRKIIPTFAITLLIAVSIGWVQIAHASINLLIQEQSDPTYTPVRIIQDKYTGTLHYLGVGTNKDSRYDLVIFTNGTAIFTYEGTEYEFGVIEQGGMNEYVLTRGNAKITLDNLRPNIESNGYCWLITLMVRV